MRYYICPICKEKKKKFRKTKLICCKHRMRELSKDQIDRIK